MSSRSPISRRLLVITSKIGSRVRYELPIGGMIHGLHASDLCREVRLVMLDMLREFRLCVGWPGDEDRTGVGDRFCDLLQERVVLWRVSAPDGVGLVVNVASRSVRVDDETIHLGNIEMKDPSFVVIDP